MNRSNAGLAIGALNLGIAAGLLLSLIITSNTAFWASSAFCGLGIGMIIGWLETNK